MGQCLHSAMCLDRWPTAPGRRRCGETDQRIAEIVSVLVLAMLIHSAAHRNEHKGSGVPSASRSSLSIPHRRAIDSRMCQHVVSCRSTSEGILPTAWRTWFHLRRFFSCQREQRVELPAHSYKSSHAAPAWGCTSDDGWDVAQDRDRI